MKKAITFLTLFLATVMCSLVCFGCSELQDNAMSFITGEYTVTFDFNNGEEDKKITVNAGNTVQTPNDPQKENYIFLGWYTDESFTKKYDFSKIVNYNLHLYARYEIDAESIVNEITTSTVHALVKIYNKSYSNSFMGQVSSIQQGSGVCFHTQGGYYYVLTNCHVAYSSADQQTITVEDFRGEKHEATIYRKNASASPAIAAEYDLAILTFLYDGDELSVIPFADQSARAGDEVISLGSPGNQSHAITYGEMLGLRLANLAESDPKESNVTFEIIYHTAAVTNGSSGGPLINGDLALVGVNYAGIHGENNDSFGHGCAVPIEKVREFLALYE